MLKLVIPGKVRGKQRVRQSYINKTASWTLYTPTETKVYEKKIAICFAEQCSKYMLPSSKSGRYAIKITAYLKLAKSLVTQKGSKFTKDAYEGRELPPKKPDIDNIMKLILDGLNEILYDDDKQVVQLSGEKRYNTEEYVEVEMINLDSEQGIEYATKIENEKEYEKALREACNPEERDETIKKLLEEQLAKEKRKELEKQKEYSWIQAHKSEEKTGN